MYYDTNNNQFYREILHDKVGPIIKKTLATDVLLAGNGCILQNKLAMYYNLKLTISTREQENHIFTTFIQGFFK